MIALIHIYCSTLLCVIYKSLLIHDIQVLIYRGSTNERLPGQGVAYDSYYNETDRVNYQVWLVRVILVRMVDHVFHKASSTNASVLMDLEDSTASSPDVEEV